MPNSYRRREYKGLAKFDNFGHNVQPNFNRKSIYKTKLGGVATILLVLFLFVYFIVIMVRL